MTIQAHSVFASELGNAVPADVYHRQVLRFSINPMSTTDQINKMLNEHQAIFQAILAGAEVVWDGCNYAGRFTQDATALIDGLNLEQESETCICTLAEFLQDNLFPAEGQDVNEFVAEVAALNGEGGWYFSTAREVDVADVRDELLNLWAEQLYSGEKLSEPVALALLEDGRCDDSAYVDELREFAGVAA